MCVQLVTVDTGNKENFDLGSEKFSKLESSQIVNIDERNCVALYVKDKFSLSDEAYHELSPFSGNISRLYKVKELTKKYNSSFEIKPALDGVIGVQQSFKSCLISRVKNIPQLSPTETIKVKLSGDGTNIGRNTHVVNVTFTLLNEGSVACTASGNHTLAILQVPKNYDSLSSALKDLLQEVNDVQFITLNEARHQIQYFLGGDMKFLAIVCCIAAANSDHSCVVQMPSSRQMGYE